MVKTIQAMKKIDEIKIRRQQRFFNRRMAKAKAKKEQDVENELITHSGLIENDKVKAYIEKKKEVKRQAYNKKHGIKEMVVKDDMMEESSSEEEAVPVKQKVLAKVAPKRMAKTKVIKKWSVYHSCSMQSLINA